MRRMTETFETDTATLL